MTRRDGLIGHVDRYLQALVAHEPAGLPLAPGVRYTENGQELALGSGLWGTASDVPAHDYAWVADDGGAQIGWIGVVHEHGRPSVVFLRLRVRDDLITEVESIVRRPHQRLYAPENMRRAARDRLRGAGARPARRRRAADRRRRPLLRRHRAGRRLDHPRQRRHAADRERHADRARVATSRTWPAARARTSSRSASASQVQTRYFSYIEAVRDRRIVAVDTARGLMLMVAVIDHPARKRTVDMKGVGEVELPEYHQVPNSVLDRGAVQGPRRRSSSTSRPSWSSCPTGPVRAGTTTQGAIDEGHVRFISCRTETFRTTPATATGRCGSTRRGPSSPTRGRRATSTTSRSTSCCSRRSWASTGSAPTSTIRTRTASCATRTCSDRSSPA